jgi:protease secretion system outer membrane protein
MFLRFLLFLGGILVTSSYVYAINVYELYSSALINDPEFQVAVAEKDSALQNTGINRSFLLPNLSYGYNKSYNQQNLTILQSGQSGSTPYYYDSVINQLTLNQTIFNYAQYANYRKGIAQAAFGIETYKSKAQNLGLRLLSAYFDVLYSKDQINLLNYQIKTLSQQSQFHHKALQVGQSSKTDLLETESRLEIAQSQLIEASSNLTINLRALQTITGFKAEELKDHIDPLKKDFSFFVIAEQTLEEIERLATANNPDILAAKQGVEAAKQDVNIKQGGNYPTVSLQGSYGKTISQYTTQINQQYTGGAIGAQLTVPLFAGGYNVYATRQAQSNFEMAQADLNMKNEKLRLELLKQFNGLKSLKAQVMALTKAQQSTLALVEANKKSVFNGIKSNLDLLISEQQLLQVSRDLQKAKYDYLLAYARLKVGIGSFQEMDLEKIASNLTSK